LGFRHTIKCLAVVGTATLYRLAAVGTTAFYRLAVAGIYPVGQLTLRQILFSVRRNGGPQCLAVAGTATLAIVPSSFYGERVEPFGHLFCLFYLCEAVPQFYILHFDF
jgi:hypothetical protein